MLDVSRCEELLNRVKENPKDGVAANELLSCFDQGFAIGKLRELITNADDSVVEAGTWIASELGRGCRSLLDDIVKLLSHRSPYVRYLAVNAVLLSVTVSDGRVVVAVAMLLSDPEAPVRRKAMDFLAKAPREVLEAAVPELRSSNVELGYLAGFRTLVAQNPMQEARGLLRSDDPIRRKFGGVVVARAFGVDEDLLREGMRCGDRDVRIFLEDLESL